MKAISQQCLRGVLGTLVLLVACNTKAPAMAEEGDLLTGVLSYPKYFCELEGSENVISGYVDMQFTVTTDGFVRDPFVIGSRACSLEFLPRIEKAAIETLLERYRYKPKVVDGKAVEVPGITARVSFYFDPTPKDSPEEQRVWTRQEFLEYVNRYIQDHPDQPPSTWRSRFRMFAD